MSFKTYGEYNVSEIEWFGQIPSHWSLCKIKNNIDYYLNGAWGSEENGDENDIICVRIADFKYGKCSLKSDDFTIRNIIVNDKRLLLEKGDLLIEKSGGGEKVPVGRVVMFDKDFDAVSSNFISKIKINKNNYSRFFLYLFNFLYSSKVNIKSIKQTTGIQNLDSYSYFNENIYIPNFDEQKKIADYLDKKTSEIDENIAKNKELISLLEEKKTALINQVVTKGLDPNVPMKDSGIEWIGKIPNDWTIFKLKHLCDTFGRIGFRGYNASDLVSEGEGALTLGGKHIQNNKLDLSDPEYLSWEKYYESPEIMVQLNDLIITQRGTLGKTVFIDKDIGPATINPSMILLKNVSCNPKFLYYFLCSSFTLKNIELLNSQTAVPMISQEQANNFRIIIPNKDEQDKIVKFLDENIRVIEQTISKIQENIDLLEEYKTSLIHHAVTGKIDVRDEI